MTETPAPQGESGWPLVSGIPMKRQIPKRLADYAYQTVSPTRRSEFESQGWVVDKRLKRSLRMRKTKSHDVAFEDRVWAMFARLGFSELNEGRRFVLPYGGGRGEGKQIDVVAIDDEVIVLVECKSSAADAPPSNSLKTEVETIRGMRPGLVRSLKQRYPLHKIQFLVATNNLLISDDSIERMEAADISFLDEDGVDYYLDLAEHLGVAAKYQLLGNLFQGKKIAGLHPVVPAIQSKMGGYTYYSFAIEPERLLKIAYVLHRSKANNRSMPTYQRVIKRSRLKRVSAFVENGGFFPNSLVLNIDGGKKINFDRVQQKDASSTLGLLHLPQAYRSAYVIDGQHRLYGYANSDRGSSELIPVVAFVDLPAHEQVRLFMQINENQQAVPKNLRNTLNSDLLWDAPDLRERSKALRLRVAQALGEDKGSPLRGRVIVGEDKTTLIRCISIDAVGRGIDRGRFVGVFSTSEMKYPGSFYRGDKNASFKPLVGFLSLCFQQLRDSLPEQWNLGRSEGGFVFTNNGIEALLRLFGDIVDFEVERGRADPRVASAQQTYERTSPWLKVIADYISNLTLEEGQELKRMYGSAAATKYWRRFQAALNAFDEEFNPPGLTEYLQEESRVYDADVSSVIADIDQHVRADIRRRLEDRYGSTWYKDAIPQRVYQDGSSEHAQRSWAGESPEDVDWWTFVRLADLAKVLVYRQEIWSQVFADGYTAPSEQTSSGGWKSRAGWLARVARIQLSSSRGDAVSEGDFAFLLSVQAWLGLSVGRRNEVVEP